MSGPSDEELDRIIGEWVRAGTGRTMRALARACASAGFRAGCEAGISACEVELKRCDNEDEECHVCSAVHRVRRSIRTLATAGGGGEGE